MASSVHRLLITLGKPAGTGPGITLEIAQHAFNAEIFAIADPDLLAARAQLLGLNAQLNIIDKPGADLQLHQPGQLNVLPVQLAVPSVPGRLDIKNSAYVLECLTRAAQYCLTQQASAMVTGPVNKSIINDAGIPFTGHTEFLGELSGSKHAMMLAAIHTATTLRAQ